MPNIQRGHLLSSGGSVLGRVHQNQFSQRLSLYIKLKGSHTMIVFRTVFLGLFVMSTTNACATNGYSDIASPVKVEPSELVPVLATPEGLSLYSFKKDAPGVSNCAGACALKWPPFMEGNGAEVAAPYSLLGREKQGQQWALDGKPLYRWLGDSKPGDVKGHGIKGVWDVVLAPGSRVKNGATKSSSDY